MLVERGQRLVLNFHTEARLILPVSGLKYMVRLAESGKA